MNAFKKSKQLKKPPQNTNPQFFITVFKKRLNRTPSEYINEKLKTGSDFEAVKYLFNIVAAEISTQNNCKFFDFNYFYKSAVPSKPQTKSNSSQKVNRPENAGKAWTKEEDWQLIQMYNNRCSKKEMSETFKRTEVAFAARLVRLGIIESRDVFISRKY